MPFYAYIKIPGVENTESTDLYYGKAWIPIRSYDLSFDKAGQDISVKSDSNEDGEKITRAELGKLAVMKKQAAQLKRLAQTAKDLMKAMEATRQDDNEESSLFDSKLEKLNERITLVQKKKHELKSEKNTITIIKMLDAATPKLHQLCMEYTHGKRQDVLLKGNVKLHICREAEKSQEGVPQLFMAYLLEKCGIASVDINASDGANLSETIKISFQQITTATNFDGNGWISKSWDMVRGEEKSTSWKPIRPSPSS
jgi:type VI protein secretion system component Hcp